MGKKTAGHGEGEGNIFLRGLVPELDQDAMTFTLQLLDGRKVSAPLNPQHWEALFTAFAGYRRRARVLLTGTGRYDREAHLRALDSVRQVTLLNEMDIPARLEELAQLKDGWLEGQGKGPSAEGLRWLVEQFQHGYPAGLPLPFVYPTPEGGIQAEWAIGEYDLSLEINLGTHQGHWHCLNTRCDVDESRHLNLDAAADWAWLVEKLREVTGAPA